MANFIIKKRTSGILLHITSLPSQYGIGDFGPGAYNFVDFLHSGKQSLWQILPLTPPNKSRGFSPYDCLSAFAGNTLLISPELLYKAGLLEKEDLTAAHSLENTRVDYKKVYQLKKRLLNKAVERFKVHNNKTEYDSFYAENKEWLDNYALFIALAEHFKTLDWHKWPREIRDKEADAIHDIRKIVNLHIEREKILQFLFFEQWFALKKYCNQHHISIIGDVPIYLSYQSADVWAQQDIFKLDREKKPSFISGVPPDFFSKTGQLWRNPIYNWRGLKKTGYHWWLSRIRHNLKLYDVIRIDHFRGLVKYWQVPAGQKTAEKGKWVKGPGIDFFNTLFKHFPAESFIAEDLGHITDDVRTMAEKFNLPGMKVLLFAFDNLSGKNSYLPHNHIENCVVYTGTHDNNTVRGWFEDEASKKQKKVLFAYLGGKVTAEKLPWELIRMAMGSVGKTAIIPMQDVLGLGSKARMNRPASIHGNWMWRLKNNQMTEKLADKLAKMTVMYGRF